MKFFATLLCLCLSAFSAAAVDLAPPQGEVVLTVTGNIARPNGDGAARFDQAMIEALEHRSTTTATPWYEGPRTFSGPLVTALLDAVGAQGGTLRLIALNDYSADVPVAELQEHPVILATHLDGARMSVREKGPFFLIYPFDEAPALFNEVYFGRSVWQVTRIEVLD